MSSGSRRCPADCLLTFPFVSPPVFLAEHSPSFTPSGEPSDPRTILIDRFISPCICQDGSISAVLAGPNRKKDKSMRPVEPTYYRSPKGSWVHSRPGIFKEDAKSNWHLPV